MKNDCHKTTTIEGASHSLFSCSKNSAHVLHVALGQNRSGLQPFAILDTVLQVLHLHQRKRKTVCSAYDISINSHQKLGSMDLPTPGACDQAITAALDNAAAAEDMLAGQESGLHVPLQSQGLAAYATPVPPIVLSCSLQHFRMVPADMNGPLFWQ